MLHRTGLKKSCEEDSCEEENPEASKHGWKTVYYHCYKHDNENNEDMSGKLEFHADHCNNGMLLLLSFRLKICFTSNSLKYEYRIVEFAHEILKQSCELPPIVNHKFNWHSQVVGHELNYPGHISPD